MSGSIVQVIEAVGAGSAATILTELSRRAATRRNAKTVAARADGAAYDRALRINEQIVADLEAQIARLRAETTELRDALARSESRNQELETRVQHLEQTGAALARKVQQLRAILDENGIPQPQDA